MLCSSEASNSFQVMALPSPGQCASNFNVHMNFLGILLKCRFHVSRSGWDLRFRLSHSSQMMLLFSDYMAVARPKGIVTIYTVAAGSLFRSGSNLQEEKSRVAEASLMTWRWDISLLLKSLGWNLCSTATPNCKGVWEMQSCWAAMDTATILLLIKSREQMLADNSQSLLRYSI